MASSATTFEVLFDSGPDQASLTRTGYALDYLARFVPEMDVIDTSRVLSIGDPAAPEVDLDAILQDELKADINIFLTPRIIPPQKTAQEQSGESVMSGTARGVAIVRQFPARQVAVVNTAAAYAITGTVTHEVGHLYKLKNSGITKLAASRHCRLDHCVMKERVASQPVTQTIKARGVRGLLEKAGAVKPRYVTNHKADAEAFCSECGDQFGQVAFFRARAKLGRFVMSEWV